jgi:G:T/U-mismatch repair DNA glycosylase
MLKKEAHPFNDTYGRTSINLQTRKLILGSFPAFQVLNQTPHLNFYYGSDDNLFWTIVGKVFGLELSTIDTILEFLSNAQLGIIDIIRTCYRKNNSSSEDQNLAIIELEDIIGLIQSTNITVIYTTSKFVTVLLKEQLDPLFKKRPILSNDYCLEYDIDNSSQKTIRIVSLLSPSPNALRGIQKLINNRKITATASEYRQDQYRSLFLIPNTKY